MNKTNDPRRTLLFLIKDDEILLAMKKRGFGANRWNGVGGKLNPGESLADAAIRECQEEIAVTPTNFWQMAEIDFTGGSDQDQWKNYVYVYLCDGWEGQPTESEEMRPEWYKLKDIPYKSMWTDDKHWLPLVLDGEAVKAAFVFDTNDQIVKSQINIVDPMKNKQFARTVLANRTIMF